MIVCKNCGHQNEEGDEFCGSCGAFLEWTGERLAEPDAGGGGAAADLAPDAPLQRQEEADPRRAERARADADAAEAGRAEAEAREQAEAAARALADAEERALAESAAAAEAAAEARRQAARAEEARLEADREARAGAEERVRAEAEERARAEAERRRRAQAEADQRAQAEARAIADAEAQAKAEEEARQLAEAEVTRAAEAVKRAEALVARASARPGPPAQAPAPRPPGRQAAPVVAGSPDARQPAARRPEAAPAGPVKPRPVAKSPPSREIHPGDLICGQCGEGNAPARKFCRRCGSSLVEAATAAAVALPWWKRAFHRENPAVAAGERPMRKGGSRTTPGQRVRSGFGRVARATAAVVAAVLALALVGPWRSAVTDRAKDTYSSARRAIAPTFAQIHPVKAEATSTLPGHPPDMAIDGVSNTAWSEGAPGPGEGQHLVLAFDTPVDLDKVGFSSGTSNKTQEFLAQPRPKDVHLVFSDGSTKDVTLNDSPKFQAFEVRGRAVTTVQIQIVSVYGSLKGGQDCSLAEVEFFTKK